MERDHSRLEALWPFSPLPCATTALRSGATEVRESVAPAFARPQTVLVRPCAVNVCASSTARPSRASSSRLSSALPPLRSFPIAQSALLTFWPLKLPTSCMAASRRGRQRFSGSAAAFDASSDARLVASAQKMMVSSCALASHATSARQSSSRSASRTRLGCCMRAAAIRALDTSLALNCGASSTALSARAFSVRFRGSQLEPRLLVSVLSAQRTFAVPATSNSLARASARS
mmetsp:Transcript_45370/g.134306  ORF Transcript_45370/g.134306 Transcript_45370/m.134306 type:complete len:232 (+) Transcript_45370:347-1042(+)